MAHPLWTEIPSESTIEVMGNHALLSQLPPTSWVFVPTRPQEKILGFDASIQNTKLALIQYKRVAKKYATSIRVDLDTAQLAVIHTVTARIIYKPFFYYAFSTLTDYSSIDACYNSRPPTSPNVDFLRSCVFIDCHKVPSGTNSLSYRLGTTTANANSGRHSSTTVPIIDGNTFVAELLKCLIGVLNGEVSEALPIQPSLSSYLGRTSALLWHP